MGITNADLEEYFSRCWEIIGVSREKEKKKGSIYIEFSNEDPVDPVVLVGVQNVKKALLEVERGHKRMAGGGSKEQARAAEDNWYPRKGNTGKTPTKGVKARRQVENRKIQE